MLGHKHLNYIIGTITTSYGRNKPVIKRCACCNIYYGIQNLPKMLSRALLVNSKIMICCNVSHYRDNFLEHEVFKVVPMLPPQSLEQLGSYNLPFIAQETISLLNDNSSHRWIQIVQRFLTSFLNRSLADSKFSALNKTKMRLIPACVRNIFSTKTASSKQSAISIIVSVKTRYK